MDRTLLQSSKSFLHANVHCNALFAAVVSRQTDVVRLQLQGGVRLDIKVKLGAWSWETDTGEEFRVGVGLAEPYPITWCAMKYFESTGTILNMLLYHISPNSFHIERTLLHHTIMCNNVIALNILLNNGVDTELVVQTTEETNLRPIHMAARLGSCNILRCLVNGAGYENAEVQDEDEGLEHMDQKIKLKNISWAMTALPLKRTAAPNLCKELVPHVSPIEIDASDFNGSLRKGKDDLTDCWTSPSGERFKIRGKNYLKDNSMVVGGDPLL
jgi:hypothetical protein